MNGFKRVVCGILVGSLILGMCGCSKDASAWIYKSDDNTISSGQYLGYLSESINDASAMTSDKKLNTGSNSTGSGFTFSSVDNKELWKKKIGDQSVEDWVRTKAENFSKQALGAKIQLKEQNISLSEDQKNEATSKATSSYTQYGSYFYLDAQGIGEESVKSLLLSEKEYDVLFQHIYGKGGSKEVPDQEINQYITDHAADYKTITLSKKNANGDEYKGDDLAKFKSTVQSYCDEITKGGKSIDDVNKEYQISTGKTEDKVTALTAEFAFEQNDRTCSDFLNAVQGSSKPQSSSFHDAIFRQSNDGKGAEIAEDDDNFYIVQRISAGTNDNFSKYHDEALKKYKADEFNQSLYQSVSDKGLKTNSFGLHKYTPKKLEKRVDSAKNKQKKASSSKSTNSDSDSDS